MNRLRLLVLCGFVMAFNIHVPSVYAQTLHIYSPVSAPKPTKRDSILHQLLLSQITTQLQQNDTDLPSLDTIMDILSIIEEPSKEIKVKLFADGNAKTVLTSDGENAESPTANGSVGLLFERKKPYFALSGLVNVAAAEDTLKGGFGQSLLTPGTGTLGGIAELHVPFPKAIGGAVLEKFAVHFYSSVSSNTWKRDESAADIVVLGAGALLAYDLGITKNDAFYGLRIEGGPAYRGLYGDAASNASFRTATLGTEVRRFFGWEAGIALTARNLTAGITFYSFSDSSDKSIPGFSGGQLAGGISISTAIPLID